MTDGVMNAGAGQSDMRTYGRDMQHVNNSQVGVGDERPQQQEVVYPSMSAGGPVKEALDKELQRHNESRSMRMQHLKY